MSEIDRNDEFFFCFQNEGWMIHLDDERIQ